MTGLTRATPRDPFWVSPPAALMLAGDEVHVWRVDVRSAYARRNDLWRVLAKDERQKATDLVFEGDRKRFVVSRGVLRVLLGRYLRAQPGSLVFGYNPYGKPFLVGAPGVRFSTSHSHDLVLLAFVRDRDIGVDVEHLRDDLGLDEIASRHFATREVATLRSLTNSSRKEAFFACWTRKEAFVKAKGRGLTLPFSRFEVTLTPGQPAMLLKVEEDIREPFRWAMQELIPGPGYAAALVVDEHNLRSSCWQYTG
ncbi:MAG: 4'-phosphopantetheinyl transferase [uncultured Rubrobacteraceae bacterium]|uniref:4'-phosphopantetheinyl transferase n=1 Tax=uncultured Rubrobacteraceae bacterium TaxID=349277 RepID=A0A6J4RF67_9ACTN|nr:MAG: 4'-phosphopantetheinyl transferase [uncultured Rubrobacteraceae bacterium]